MICSVIGLKQLLSRVLTCKIQHATISPSRLRKQKQSGQITHIFPDLPLGACIWLEFRIPCSS